MKVDKVAVRVAICGYHIVEVGNERTAMSLEPRV